MNLHLNVYPHSLQIISQEAETKYINNNKKIDRRQGVIGSYSTNSDQQRQVGYGVSKWRVHNNKDDQGICCKIKIKVNKR